MIPEAQAVALAHEGVVVERYETDAAGRECAVDRALQVHLLRAGFDFRPAATVVLLTGGGAGYSQGLGFWADARRLYEIGWEVELVSWNRSCNHRFRKWVAEVGTYIPLGPFCEQCTFQRNGRTARELSDRDYEFIAKGR